MKRKVLPRVFILARTTNRRCWSGFLERRLRRLGIPIYRCTPDCVPKYRPERVKLVINYGCGTTPAWWDRLHPECVVLNTPEEVSVSANKVRMMEALPPNDTLSFTKDKATAQQHIDDGCTIVARTLLSSHSGRGIVVSPPAELPDAKLYTVLQRKRGLREYRVWFTGGEVLDIACKRRWRTERLIAAGIDPNDRIGQIIRAHRYGWAFTRNNLPCSNPLVFEAITRVAKDLLAWGCVDVLIDTETENWVIVETNSAPGMSDKRTRDAIVGSFVRIIKDSV